MVDFDNNIVLHNASFGSEHLLVENQFLIRGFQEVIISVRNAEKTSEFYCKVAGWKFIHQAVLSDMQLKYWGLSTDLEATEILLHNPGDSEGFLRVISFGDVKQKHIRSSSQSWDTGGIYDIDVRVVDLQNSYEEFRSAGWTAYNDPLEYEFDKFHISEVLLHGPEDIVVALIQRHKPTLEGYPNLRKLSHIFNSSQIVEDIEVSKQFYMDVLGFKIYMEHNLVGSETGENLFGLPKNLYKEVERRICILHPEGSNSGSVELIQLVGVEGTSYADDAVPPNLGILSLRFPVLNMAALIFRLESKEVKILNDDKIMIEPYGLCHTICIQSPDGAWLEFFEICNS